MKRLIVFGLVLAVLGGGVFAYYQYGGTPEVRRERYLKKGEGYLKDSKLNEAIVEFRNAVKADPRSPDARFKLAEALLRLGDARAAYGELIRVIDLKPGFIKARYELGLLDLLRQNLVKAKEQHEKL